jgi:hypothetical protein
VPRSATPAKRPRKTMERYGGSRDTRAPTRQGRSDVERGVEDTSRARPAKVLPPARRPR